MAFPERKKKDKTHKFTQKQHITANIHQWYCVFLCFIFCTQVHILQQADGCGNPGTCVSENDSRFKSWHANLMLLKPFRHTSLITAIRAALSILKELDSECWPNQKHETPVFFYEVGCYSKQDKPPIYRASSTISSQSFIIHGNFQ